MVNAPIVATDPKEVAALAAATVLKIVTTPIAAALPTVTAAPVGGVIAGDCANSTKAKVRWVLRIYWHFILLNILLPTKLWSYFAPVEDGK